MIKKIVGFLPLLFIGFFLIVKVILLFYNIYDVWIVAGRIAPFLEIPMYTEAILSFISLIGLIIRKEIGFILILLFPLVMIEYFIFFKLFSIKPIIDVIEIYGFQVLTLLLILFLLTLNRVWESYFKIKNRSQMNSTLLLSLGLSALILLVMNYSYLLFR